MFVFLNFWIRWQVLNPQIRSFKMNPNIPVICVKCSTEKGTLFHCLWKCPKTKRFWSEVLKCISQIISKPVPHCPKLCIQFVSKELCFELQWEESDWFTSITSKTLNLSLLEGCEMPLDQLLAKGTLWMPSSEKLTHSLGKKSAKFQEVWNLFLSFFENYSLGESQEIHWCDLFVNHTMLCRPMYRCRLQVFCFVLLNLMGNGGRVGKFIDPHFFLVKCIIKCKFKTQ